METGVPPRKEQVEKKFETDFGKLLRANTRLMSQGCLRNGGFHRHGGKMDG